MKKLYTFTYTWTTEVIVDHNDVIGDEDPEEFTMCDTEELMEEEAMDRAECAFDEEVSFLDAEVTETEDL